MPLSREGVSPEAHFLQSSLAACRKSVQQPSCMYSIGVDKCQGALIRHRLIGCSHMKKATPARSDLDSRGANGQEESRIHLLPGRGVIVITLE